MKRNCLIFLGLLFSSVVIAQQPKNHAIDINSAYQPVLRDAAKINFSPQPLPADTTHPSLAYDVPVQNLFYSYLPVSLRPLALTADTALYLGDRDYLKLGYGNFSMPYVDGGASFGDGKHSLLNVTADFLQASGKIKNQDYMHFKAEAAGSYFFTGQELYGALSVTINDNYLYGYNHALVDYTKAQVKQPLTDYALRLGFKNTAANSLGVNYDPNISVDVFANAGKANETDAVINLPVNKTINAHFSAQASLSADITSYSLKQPAAAQVNNNIVSIAPAVLYHDDVLKLHVGIKPSWDNGQYSLLPDFVAEYKLKDQPFSLQAGWTGTIIKNSYKNLTNINPWLAPVSVQQNTKETEYYGGLKASVAKHFNLSVTAGLVHYNNLPFFINDTTDEKSFVISNESRVNDLRLHGDLSFIGGDRFTITGGVTFNGYTSLRNNARAWNTVPVEISGSLRWWVLKTVLLKSDLYVFDGSNYLAKGNVAVPFNGGTDLSAGVEIKVKSHISVWLDANNILNDEYQRWHNYPVYGANFIGGVLFNF